MKQKRSSKNRKTTKKTTRKVARRSNLLGRKHREDPKGFAAQSSGVKITNSKVDVDGDIIGRDKIIYEAAPEQFDYLHQLPSPPADFVGRDAELKTLREYVKQGGATICAARGLGGVGKTTLALKLAHDLKSDYPDAQFYLNLQGASDKPLSPSDALAHVIRAYHPTAKLPESEVELRSIYLSVLDGKRALLLMDNAKDAEQVEPLIPPSNCLLLVTSRQKFVLPDIRTIDLDELSLEESRNLLNKIVQTRYASSRSAAKRDGASLPNDTATEIANLCGRLPLALRLAGSALAEHIDLEPSQYAKRLQNKKNRLQLIEASFSLSYDLLNKKQQKLWRMLAIFPSSFEVMGACAIWKFNVIPRSVLSGARSAQSKERDEESLGLSERFLASLGMTTDALDKTLEALSDFLRYSILDYDPTTKRYSLHDLAKVFADSRISEKEKYEPGLRHATYYKDVLSLANQLYQKGFENIRHGLKLFDDERDNIQHGQAWASARAEKDNDAARLCNAYSGNEIITLRLHSREQIRWLEFALIASRKLKDKGAEGIHLGNLGFAYSHLGEARKAIEIYEKVLQIMRDEDKHYDEGAVVSNLGLAYSQLGETRKAIELYDQGLKIAREIGDKRSEGNALGNLGLAYSDLGETRKAIEYKEQTLVIMREIGDKKSESGALINLGVAYSQLGETRKAIELYDQGLKIARQIGYKHWEGNALGGLGSAYSNLGETRKAIEYHEQSLKIKREIGDKRGEGNALGNLGSAYKDLGETRKAIEYHEQSLKIKREIGDKRGEGNSLGNLGTAYKDLGETRKAVEYHEQALKIYREIGDRRGEAIDLNNFGEAYIALKESSRAIEYCDEALNIFREIGHKDGIGFALFNKALALDQLGERQQAIELATESLKIRKEIESAEAEKVRKQLEEWRGEKH